jgi:CO/xanthine dehydrogenase Mo-binding subunit
MADTDLVPFDMGTFGSLSTPQMAPLMRRAAATAREWLIDLAAERFACDRASLAVEDGAVREKGGKTATFAELVKGRNAATSVAGNIAIAKPRCESVPKWTAAPSSPALTSSRPISSFPVCCTARFCGRHRTVRSSCR